VDGRKRDITNEWKRAGHAGGNGAGKEERDEAGGGGRGASDKLPAVLSEVAAVSGKGGAAALVHRSRGGVSNRTLSDEVRSRIVELYPSDDYKGFGPFCMLKSALGSSDQGGSRDGSEAAYPGRVVADLSGNGKSGTGRGESSVLILERWCRWTARITDGSRSVEPRSDAA